MLQNIIAQALDTQKQSAVIGGEVELMEMNVPAEELSIHEGNIAIDALVATGESFSALAETCFAAAKNGGLEENAIDAIVAGVQGSGRVIGVDVELPSGESFGETGGRVDATMLAGESIMGKAKEIGKAVYDFIVRQLKRLKELWKTYFTKLGRMKGQIANAQEKYADVKGKASKAKFKMNLASIMKGNSPATANEVKTDAENATKLAASLKEAAKKAKEAAKSLGEDKVDEVVAALSGEDAKFDIDGAKTASDVQIKKAGLQKGYADVNVLELLGGDFIATGTPGADSKNGPTAKFVAGSPDKKKADAEHATLGASDISAYLEAAEEQRVAAEDLSAASEEFTSELDALVKALKGADAGENNKEAYEKALAKSKDQLSIVSDGLRGVIAHCVSAGSTSYNYAVKSAKLYKED